jgi:glycosidase
MYSQNFYGGDLAGITSKLDYLDSLGITAIYLNPIFESPSNHKYDTTDFFHIDDNLGDLATFQTLVTEAHARGIKVILDGVFNHSSSDSVYFDRYHRWTGASSPSQPPIATDPPVDDDSGACESTLPDYADWYTFFNYTGTGTAPCSDNRDYPKWYGIFDSLPVFKHDEPQVRDYFINNGTSSVGPYWMQWADGWRLDVAPEIDPGTLSDPNNDYWEDFRAAVRTQNPDTYIVGEEWGNATSWTIGGEWDATMNYQFSAAVLSFWRDTAYTDNDFNTGSSAGVLNPLTAEGVNERLLNLKERYSPEAFAAMLNLFGSHDTNRAMFLLDHNTGSNDTALYNNPAYDWSDSITRLKGAALMQMTLPGAPTVYYGDEIGLVGPVAYDGSQWQDDPYNRQPYPWLDESGTPYYNHLQSATQRDALYAYYQTLTGTRNSHPALRTGSFDPLWTETGSNIYAYGRKMDDDSDTAIIVVNKDATAGSVTLDLAGYIPAEATLTDALTTDTYTVSASGQLVLSSVPARGGLLLMLGGFAGRPTAPAISASSGSGIVTLNWADTGADSYDVYRSRLSGGGYFYLGNTTDLGYTDTNVDVGTQYHYVVVAKDNDSLLESEYSNEVSAIPAYVVGWANLQTPPAVTHTRSLTLPTANIYGQVWIDGATSAAGATPSLTAQVGYGADGTLPTDASWQWFDAAFNTDVGNNDEFAGQMTVNAPPGEYDYLYRYSTDGGATWVYGAYGDPHFYPSLASYDPNDAGQMTVNSSSDVEPPAAPTNLDVTYTTTGSISLGWDLHLNTASDLYGFEIWRKDTTIPEASFTRIKLLAGASTTSYTDSTVTANHSYSYYLTAVDTAANISTPSNTVNGTAETLYVDVTFSVTAPDPSPGTIYIAGNFGGFPGSTYPSWDPAGIALTESATPGIWEVTLELPDGYGLQYKYTRGGWDKVEKAADGNSEISNRTENVSYGGSGTQTVNNVIANWRDPLVTSVSPAGGASGQPNSSVVAADWNQAMSVPGDPGYAACISVTGHAGPVTGTVAYNNGAKQYTFTPSSLLDAGLHTVNISGCKDAGGDNQMVAKSWSFTVADSIAPSITAINVPASSSSLNVPITAFTASDNMGVTDYMITTTSTPPLPSDINWASTAPIVYAAGAEGSFSLYPWAKDAAGNVSAVYGSPASVIVDLSAPTVLSITRPDPDPTNLSSVGFNVTFSEPVTGVDLSDFRLAASPSLTDSLLFSISGSGASYYVTVKTGSGDGTLALNVYNNSTIEDVRAGKPLADSFSGPAYTVGRKAPTVLSIARKSSGASNLTFTVTFSEAVSGVDIADFMVVMTGTVTGARVQQVTGSNNQYTVTVSNILGGRRGGTLSLKVLANGTILDLHGNSLAGPFTGPAIPILPR